MGRALMPTGHCDFIYLVIRDHLKFLSRDKLDEGTHKNYLKHVKIYIK